MDARPVFLCSVNNVLRSGFKVARKLQHMTIKLEWQETGEWHLGGHAFKTRTPEDAIALPAGALDELAGGALLELARCGHSFLVQA